MRTYNTNLAFFFFLVVLAVISYVMEGRFDKQDHQADEQMMTWLNVQQYEPFYSLASNQTERDELNQLESDTSLGIGVWTREALMIVGKLPADQARLTLEEAEEIMKKTEEPSAIIEQFNDVAGAPDWQGGSGVDLKIYYVDDEKRDAITVTNRMVISYVTYDETGEQSVKRLKNE